jgi:phi13 family phage major tail protein
MADKVKFGIKNVHIFPITAWADGVPTYGTVINVPGTVNLSLDKQGDTNDFYADNIKYYTSVANNGYSGTLEVAVIPDAFRTEILGYITDDNDVLVEEMAEPNHFAMTFEEDGDQKGTKFVLYNGTATRPSLEKSTTTDSKEPSTQTLDISFAPLTSGRVMAMTTDSTDSTVLTGWHTAPYIPEITEP